MNTGSVFITKDAENNLSIEWNIPDFFPLEKIYKKTVKSPAFEYFNLNWGIKLNKIDGYWNIDLCHNTPLVSSHSNVYYNIGIKKIDGTVYKSRRSQITLFNGFHNHETKETFQLPSDLQRDKADISPRNALVVFCNLSLYKNPKEIENSLINKESEKRKFKNVCAQTENADCSDACTETLEEDFQEIRGGVHCESDVTQFNSSGTYELVKNLRDLFVSGEDNDTVMTVGDKEFRVHKAILRARSTVFSAMFKHDMKEPRSGIVDITDCDPQVFEQFLLYVYTGKVDCLSPENVCHLYQMADKFDIQDLKTECLEYMQKNLSIESFCDVMSLSLLHNETGLLENATQFFLKNAPKIVVTVKWISFMKEKPIEANELIIKGFTFLAPSNDSLS